MLKRTKKYSISKRKKQLSLFYRSPPSVRKTLSNTNGTTATSAAAHGQSSNASPITGTNNGNIGTLSPPPMSNRNRSRSPTPKPMVTFKNDVGGTTSEHLQVKLSS